MKLEKAIDRAFDTCNLIGNDVDIYEVMYRYKAIRELPEEKIDEIYEGIADRLGFNHQTGRPMKEILSAVPTLSRLMNVRPDMIRAHIKYKVGDIGRYCFMADKTATGKMCNQYFVMRSDLPKILHRELSEDEQSYLG